MKQDKSAAAQALRPRADELAGAIGLGEAQPTEYAQADALAAQIDAAQRGEEAQRAQAEKLAVVMGTEGDGLADATIAACDFTVRIPMHHGVDSLNVAAASAVAFYQLGRRA